MNLPPNRSHIETEQRHHLSADIHNASVEDCLRLIQEADQEAVNAVRRAGPAITTFIATIENDFINGGRLIYIGAGTSGRLGVLDASEAPPTFCVDPERFIGIIAGGDKSLRTSSEGMEDDPNGTEAALSALSLNEKDCVLGIAAGGTTPYARGACAVAKRLGNTHTALLSCATVEKPDQCDMMIYCPTGPEILTGSTRMKAGTACKLILNQISTTLMIRSGRVYQNLMVDVKASNDKLRDRAARIISTLCEIEREAAFAVLEQAHGNCKQAIIMHKRSCSYDEAHSLLEQHHGHLGPCIE